MAQDSPSKAALGPSRRRRSAPLLTRNPLRLSNAQKLPRLGRVEGALRADRCLHGQDSIDRRLIKPGDVG